MIRSRKEHAVVDCSLIFEWGIECDLDLVICVYADPEIRKKRIMGRDGRSSEEIEGIFRAQMSEDKKIRCSHMAFANDKAPEILTSYGVLIAEFPRLLAGRL